MPQKVENKFEVLGMFLLNRDIFKCSTNEEIKPMNFYVVEWHKTEKKYSIIPKRTTILKHPN